MENYDLFQFYYNHELFTKIKKNHRCILIIDKKKFYWIERNDSPLWNLLLREFQFFPWFREISISGRNFFQILGRYSKLTTRHNNKIRFIPVSGRRKSSFHHSLRNRRVINKIPSKRVTRFREKEKRKKKKRLDEATGMEWRINRVREKGGREG